MSDKGVDKWMLSTDWPYWGIVGNCCSSLSSSTSDSLLSVVPLFLILETNWMLGIYSFVVCEGRRKHTRESPIVITLEIAPLINFLSRQLLFHFQMQCDLCQIAVNGWISIFIDFKQFVNLWVLVWELKCKWINMQIVVTTYLLRRFS